MDDKESIVVKNKKEKKDKKDKKEKKKDKKKNNNDLPNEADGIKAIGNREINEDDERYKPVRNPDYNPLLASSSSSSSSSPPMMNTTNNNTNNNSSSNSSTSNNNNNNNNEERWIISSKRKEVPVIQIPSSPVKEKKSTSPTPAELQGFTAQKFVPGSSYSHLDPAKSENAHAAFNHLQKLLSNNNNTNSSSSNGSSSRIPIERKEDPESSSSRPKVIQQQQQQQHRVQSPNNSEIPQRQNQAQQIKNNKSTCPERTMDGMPILQYVRALWNYTAQIPSELSFNANDKFAVLNRQPDGWWYAELLDSNKRTRGLIPGNYMTPA